MKDKPTSSSAASSKSSSHKSSKSSSATSETVAIPKALTFSGAQTVKFTLGANYGHVADTTDHSMDMYIVANDGNIYEFKLAQGASSLAPLYGDEHALENDVVGYQADKVSESFNY